MPGKNPASATPSANRRTATCSASVANAVTITTIPQLIEYMGNPIRAPTRWRIRLLGNSKSRYPIKKIPGSKIPNTSLERPSALFISSAAKPKFTRPGRRSRRGGSGTAAAGCSLSGRVWRSTPCSLPVIMHSRCVLPPIMPSEKGSVPSLPCRYTLRNRNH